MAGWPVTAGTIAPARWRSVAAGSDRTASGGGCGDWHQDRSGRARGAPAGGWRAAGAVPLRPPAVGRRPDAQLRYRRRPLLRGPGAPGVRRPGQRPVVSQAAGCTGDGWCSTPQTSPRSSSTRPSTAPSTPSIHGRQGTCGSTVRRTGSKPSRPEPPVTVPVWCSSRRSPMSPGSGRMPWRPAPGGWLSTITRPSSAAPGRSSDARTTSTLSLTSSVAGGRGGYRRSWRPSPGSPPCFAPGRRPTAGQPPSPSATRRC